MSIDPAARQRFLNDYRRIRYAEGRGSDRAAYYCDLPYNDLSGLNRDMWKMRAATYSYFVGHVLKRFEDTLARPIEILDLGAGNCWMSYRLKQRGHHPVALDIFRDERDGLLAARHYPVALPAVEAEFDDLPFGEATFDLAIYNSSLHYSTDYVRTFSQVQRCLRPQGAVIVLDSPVYRRKEHGAQMVAERRRQFLSRYGTPSDAIPSIEFLDRNTLGNLGRALQIRWRIHRPWYGWRWHLRPFQAWLKRRRPPSRFWILEGTFQSR